MSNTLNGTSLTAIAQQSLDTIIEQLPPLTAFTTDFSAEAVVGGSCTTRFIAKPTVGNLETSGYAGSAQAITATARTITMSAVTGSSIRLTESEVAGSPIDLYRAFLRPLVEASAEHFVKAAFAAVTESSYTSEKTIAPAEFTRDKITELGAQMSKAGVKKAGRTLIVNSDCFQVLLQDDVISRAAYMGDTGPIQNGIIPNLHGFRVIEYNLDDNDQNLVGVACVPQALIVAARVPDAKGFGGEVELARDENSGFAVQVRKWYSDDYGSWFLSTGFQYGVQVGVAENLIRIVSA